MSHGTVNSRTNAAALLAEYLSLVLKASIAIPNLPDGDKPVTSDLRAFVECLPGVVQQAVDGEWIKFDLPLVASSKGTSLSQPVADVVSALLASGSREEISCPTFFYTDGSAMVLNFKPERLGDAITILTQSEEVRVFIRNAIAGLRGG